MLGAIAASSLLRVCRVDRGQSSEAFGVWGACDSAIGNDRGDQFVRGNVEGKVVDTYTIRRLLMILDVRHFFRVALFDGDALARGCR